VCFKKGHLVGECWHIFDDTYAPEERYVRGAYSAYGTDPYWYLDIGATDHVMGEMEKLTKREKYKGNDQIHDANGASMRISHIGHSIVNSPHCRLMLRNVLHVPKAYKNLVSVSRLTKDNHVYLEIHPYFFLLRTRFRRKFCLVGTVIVGSIPLLVLRHSSKSVESSDPH
jgi:hypothetical protein